jgi:hypothetical protein
LRAICKEALRWPITVRVELHSAEWEDYDVLRVEMEAEGFGGGAGGSGGMAYELPRVEYAVSGDVTRQQVLARVRRAADQGGCSYAVLVTESAGRAWCALEPAV